MLCVIAGADEVAVTEIAALLLVALRAFIFDCILKVESVDVL